MKRVRQSQIEARRSRLLAVLHLTEAEAQRLRDQILPSYDVPAVSEQTHAALDFINAWVAEARHLHRLAEREAASCHKGRKR